MDTRGFMHSEKCLDKTTTLLKLCKDCRNNYKKENKRLNKLKKAGAITQTRSATINSRSKYWHVLCEECKDKPLIHSCGDCKKKVQSARYKASQNNKKNNLDVVSKAIIPTNQENSTINDSDDINSNDGIGGTS